MDRFAMSTVLNNLGELLLLLFIFLSRFSFFVSCLLPSVGGGGAALAASGQPA